jgi:hypothetical protein
MLTTLKIHVKHITLTNEDKDLTMIIKVAVFLQRRMILSISFKNGMNRFFIRERYQFLILHVLK